MGEFIFKRLMKINGRAHVDGMDRYESRKPFVVPAAPRERRLGRRIGAGQNDAEALSELLKTLHDQQEWRREAARWPGAVA